ncbi:MAG: hypothetical protein HQK59_13455 [Deltaproteobacteria bacterium]|nr:hypothetical protein [Deltaproteobacteria bacterium]
MADKINQPALLGRKIGFMLKFYRKTIWVLLLGMVCLVILDGIGPRPVHPEGVPPSSPGEAAVTPSAQAGDNDDDGRRNHRQSPSAGAGAPDSDSTESDNSSGATATPHPPAKETPAKATTVTTAITVTTGTTGTTGTTATTSTTGTTIPVLSPITGPSTSPASPDTPVIALKTNADRFAPGDTLRMTIDLINGAKLRRVDIFVYIITPNGLAYSHVIGQGLIPANVDDLRNTLICSIKNMILVPRQRITDYLLLEITFPSDENLFPQGTYSIHCFLAESGTNNQISELAGQKVELRMP